MILLDTTILSNFAHMGRPDLPRLALSEAVTTPQVVMELRAGIAAGYVPDCDWQWLPVVTLTSEESERYGWVRLILDDGEASCVAVALERGGVLFTDDLDARYYARRHGVRVSGTLGVLSVLAKDGHLTLDQADALLQQAIHHGYRSPVKSLSELKGMRGEENST